MIIRNNNRDTVGWSDEKVLAKNHVAICVTITGCAELWCIFSFIVQSHYVHEVRRVGQVRIQVTILQISPHEVYDTEKHGENPPG